MMINFFAMQIERGWITLEQVPKRYRAKVKELLELSGIESGAEEGGK
ncbi:CD1375 family protein [Streptococcus sp. 121]|nr:CD1375 family protein [Streptococcus sp. 121]